jgi:hypothetical protein
VRVIEGTYLGEENIGDGKIVGGIEPEQLPQVRVPIGLIPDRAQEGDTIRLSGIVSGGDFSVPKERTIVIDRIENGVAVVQFLDEGGFQISAERLPNPHEGGVYELVPVERPHIEERLRNQIEELQEDLIEQPEEG